MNRLAPTLASNQGAAEVAIIGAGIMGLCTGLHLARAGKEVLILERGEPWREASGVNAGSLAVQNKRLPLVPLTLEAIRLWETFAELLGRDVEYVQCGGLRVATSPEEVVRLNASATQQRAAGVTVELWEGDELRRRAPWLSPRVCAAGYCPQDGFANSLLLGHILVEAVRHAGGRVVPQVNVQDVQWQGDRVRLITSAGPIDCRALVIAAGVWSGAIGRMLHVDLPVALDVNMLTVTEPTTPVMDRIVTHLRGILTVKQLSNGTCLIGGGWQGRGDLATGRKGLDYDSLLHNLRLAASVVPGLQRLHIVRSWAGFEGVTPDSLPLFGRLPGHANVFITACARGGWTLGPVLGRLLGELILTGETSLPISEFDPSRFLR